jgi:UDP-N-acetyl-2-amino-2-deoxyglucuronate dehydrogenase
MGAAMHNFPAPITGRKIRFALAGCGRIAKNHFSAIAQHHENCELVSVCDIDEKALNDATRSSGARAYVRLGTMLDESDADVVVLCTPSGLHSEQAIQIARTGRHVITEKPMATRWEDGKRMVSSCLKGQSIKSVSDESIWLI